MLFPLILKNIFRARLRSLLTIVGLVIAVIAFGLLRTVVDAWYAGSDMASGIAWSRATRYRSHLSRCPPTTPNASARSTA